MCVVSACVCAVALCAHSRGTAGYLWLGLRRALAAGAMWTSRTASAPWAGRYGHTTVIDAAGAIYVIGGIDDTVGYYRDVWMSPDGGV